MDKVVVDVISIVIICITLCFLLLAIPFNLKEDYEIKGIGKFIRFTKNNSKYKRIAYVIYPFLAVYILFYIGYFGQYLFARWHTAVWSGSGSFCS